MRDFSIRLILSLATVLSVGAQTLDLGATPVPGAATEATVPAATPIPSTRAPVDDGWSGCVDPSKPEELIKIGKKTTICIVLGSSTNWNVLTPATQYLRLSFQPQADEYSRFHVPSCKYSTIHHSTVLVFEEDLCCVVAMENPWIGQKSFHSLIISPRLFFVFIFSLFRFGDCEGDHSPRRIQ